MLKREKCEYKNCEEFGILRFDSTILCDKHFDEVILDLKTEYKKKLREIRTKASGKYKGGGIECSVCKSTNTVKNAIRKGRQRYTCKYCKSRFTNLKELMEEEYEKIRR